MRDLRLYENRESHVASYIEKSGFCEKTGCIRKPILTGFLFLCNNMNLSLIHISEPTRH